MFTAKKELLAAFFGMKKFYHYTSARPQGNLQIKVPSCRDDIPELLISDNGTQHTTEDFIHIASEWKFRHTRSTPNIKKANGAAEAVVKVIKMMMVKYRRSDKDPYIRLLEQNKRTEGLTTSPTQRFMGR
ncbi:integrase core domain [Plakobranchus ocellatus]|uniref:Integrase core domain n=1 Tax=Plakobranchus ocellatus TaxID=259542 RepID=A0AAV3Y5G6_9GAST|nr:integrase core domain [Plakobranchus ocellatus]